MIFLKSDLTDTLLKLFYEKSAQTDVSKEMCIPISKGLKHLNSVLYSNSASHFPVVMNSWLAKAVGKAASSVLP